MEDKKADATLDDFDAECADRVVALISSHRDQLNLLSDREVEFGQRMLWTLGNTPAIKDAAQCRRAAEQMVRLLIDGLGERVMDDAQVRAFLMTPEGARAIALGVRIDEWHKHTSN